MMHTLLRSVCGVVIVCLIGSDSQAAIIFELDYVFEQAGAGLSDPIASAPDSNNDGARAWLRASFQTYGGGHVELTLQAYFSDDAFIDGGGNSIGWAFNFADTKDVTKLQFEHISGNDADGIVTGQNELKNFDLFFSWKAGETTRFDGTQQAVYRIRLDGGTVRAEDFAYAAQPKLGQTKVDNEFLSIAHVQGVGADSQDSLWIGARDGTGVQQGPSVIPEPATAIVWCGLGSVFGGVTWRRRRQALRKGSAA